MMTPAQAARLFDVRDGFDLVDFAEVGLPVFRLTVEAVTLAKQEMPTTHEFVLRAIIIGETQAHGIAHLLGLTDEVVLDALNLLAYDGCVAVVQPVGDENGDASCDQYEVTDLGLERLLQGERTPQDEILVFDYDGTRRRPIKLGAESVRRPKELSERGAIQIRPYPADPPDASQLPLNEIGRAVRRLSGKEFSRGVLAVRRIVRRDNLFRPAIGLVFRNRATEEVQIGFVLGDQLAEDYEIEFSRHGGAKKPGLVRSSAHADAMTALHHLIGPDLCAKLADPEEVSRRRLEVALASRERSQLGAKLERLRQRPKLRDAEREDMSVLDERLRAARERLDEFDIRPLAPYEQWDLFNEALNAARRRLLITSTDVDPDVTHGLVLRGLNERLDEGVEVRIETSVALSTNPKGKPGSFEPGVELWLTAQQKLRLNLAQRAPEDLFFLIKDDSLAVVSNRPFLSGRERPLSFIPTVGIVTRHPEVVAEIARLAGLDHADPLHRRGAHSRD
ncbi:hypothetical protein [Microvirga sp. VF16]|uniref:hypothetical protein n=1 Tax=Microvirga sp. VF16 TaxID=2807101 RepID=UPI00193CBA62|nr:hypothetical protein [Microvirga sp. VF16]QRM35135.1 hypothetical protein JO965_39780 [Microvirga sp. VF16]